MTVKDAEKRRRYERERYRCLTAERVAAGLCPKCGAAQPEPERRLCAACGENRRASDRRRYAAARKAGVPHGGKGAEACRRKARAKSKRRYRARRSAQLCAKCGHRPPARGRSRCEACLDRRNAAERARWESRRAASRCGKCGELVPGGGSRCRGCAAIQAGRPSRKTYARKLYVRRRVRNLCTDCGAPAGNASRCEPCARRSYVRSSEHRGLPAWPALFTVIEIDTGVDHGTYDSPAEVAACLAFIKLGPDQVEIVSDASAMTRYAAWS